MVCSGVGICRGSADHPAPFYTHLTSGDKTQSFSETKNDQMEGRKVLSQIQNRVDKFICPNSYVEMQRLKVTTII